MRSRSAIAHRAATTDESSLASLGFQFDETDAARPPLDPGHDGSVDLPVSQFEERWHRLEIGTELGGLLTRWISSRMQTPAEEMGLLLYELSAPCARVATRTAS
jgi:hypothetical protein